MARGVTPEANAPGTRPVAFAPAPRDPSEPIDCRDDTPAAETPPTPSKPQRASAWCRHHPWSRLAALIIASDLAAAVATTVFSRSPAWCLLMGCMVMAAIRHSGLQRRRLAPSLLDDLPAVLAFALVGLGAVLLLRGILHWTSGTNSVRDAAHLIAFLLTFRLAVYTTLRWGRSHGHFLHRTLFIGHGRLGQVLSQTLLADPRYGLRPIGFVSDLPPKSTRQLPRLGPLSDIPDLVRRYHADAVVIADVEPAEEQLTAATRAIDGKGVAVFIVPRLWELHGSVQGAEMVRGIPLVRLSRPAYESLTWPLKRALDITVSLLALLALSPVMLACAALLRREVGRGILFRQQRIGRGDRVFELLKFRTLRTLEEPGGAPVWCIADDARLKRIGRWIRRMSLDELPQLINVLRGDMSLVGPRPERPHFVARFTTEFGEYADRHRVPCGMTGWAQIHGLRGDTSVATRARYDNYYIENWSLWLDVKILLRTGKQVIAGAGR